MWDVAGPNCLQESASLNAEVLQFSESNFEASGKNIP